MAHALLCTEIDMGCCAGKAHGRISGCTEKEVAGRVGKKSGEEQLLNHRVAARKVDLAPEKTSNCLGTGGNKKIKEV